MAVNYSSMTVREAVDRVMDKVSMFETGTKLDYKTVWMFLNRARREIFARILPYKDYAFITNTASAHGTRMPADFSRVVRVISQDGSNEYVEARQAAPQDWWRVTNTVRPHSYNHATLGSPVYVLWGELIMGTNVANTDNSLALAPNTNNADRVVLYHRPTTMTLFVEYYGSYGDLPVNGAGDPVDTATLNIPYEYENLCILMTLWRCYGRLQDKNRLMDTYKQVLQEEQRLAKVYTVKKQTEAITMQSLLNPEPSNVPAATVGG